MNNTFIRVIFDAEEYHDHCGWYMNSDKIIFDSFGSYQSWIDDLISSGRKYNIHSIEFIDIGCCANVTVKDEIKSSQKRIKNKGK